jgi:flavin reductase
MNGKATNSPAFTLDTMAFRHAMGHFATGVTVVSSNGPDGPHCMTANAVTSVSLDPALILVCVGQASKLSSYLTPGQRFVVNVLAQEQEPLARYFSRTLPPDAPHPVYRLDTIHEAPALAGCVTALICDVYHRYPGGDHSIVLGHVQALYQPGPNRAPLLFHRGQYANLSDTGDKQDLDMLNAQRSHGSRASTVAPNRTQATSTGR